MANTNMAKLASKLAVGALAKAGVKSSQDILVLIARRGGLATALKTGVRLAGETVLAIRSAPDYDPAVHGGTDEEIATWVLTESEKQDAVKS